MEKNIFITPTILNSIPLTYIVLPITFLVSNMLLAAMPYTKNKRKHIRIYTNIFALLLATV
jgi:hypothetical protein